MKTRNQMKPLARLIAASLAVGSMAGFGAQALAQTAAGTLIKNLATVTYEDESGNSYSAQSNEAVVTVAPVYSAGIEKDNDLTGAPGQTVYFPHTLSNTGNIENTFNLSAINGGVVYRDDNNNGQPDPGESIVYREGDATLSAIAVPVTIAAGSQANLVVGLAVPATAASDSVLATNLKAETANGDVTDTDNDTLDGTSDNTATVSTGPVLVINKSTVDNGDNTITYTLTVKNNGAGDALNVNIIDALPEVDHDGDSATPMVQTELVGAITTNGLVNVNTTTPNLGDIVPTTAPIVDESTIEADINVNGSMVDTLYAITAKDAILPPSTTITVTFTVKYNEDWVAGSSVNNTFIVFDDPNNDGKPTDSTAGPNTGDVIESNESKSETSQDYGVTAGSQTVASAASGAEVSFSHLITNDGNGEDVFNIAVVNGNFPENTVFTYWDATGTVQLVDTNNDGYPDTGLVGPSGSTGDNTTILIKADLPANEFGAPAGGYKADLVATSGLNPTDTPISDSAELILGSIVAPTVDIMNDIPATQGQGTTGFNDSGVENAQDEVPVVLANAAANSTITFPLKLANESGNPDSFLLSASDVPAGWKVVFKDMADNTITTTSLVPGGQTFDYKAEVTISAILSEASSNPAIATTGSPVADGYDAVNNDLASTPLASQDGDNDYQMSFTATSASTPSVSDSVTNAVDVDAFREVSLSPNGQNQVQPGGTVSSTHALRNGGNQVEKVELATENSLPGWTTVITVDTTGNGEPDTVLVAPPTGTTVIIKGVDEEGNEVDIEVTDDDGDGIPEIFLNPGESLPMTSTVSPPSDAPLGGTDLSTLSINEMLTGTQITSVENQTTVMPSQVRLDLTASVDADCLDSTPNTAFSTTPSTEAQPEQCVVWKLVATNDSASIAKNVVISDSAPAFTDIVDGTLKVCTGNGCTPVSVTDASDTDHGTYEKGTSGLVKFFSARSASSAPLNGIGGELIPGEQMTAEFKVKVQ